MPSVLEVFLALLMQVQGFGQSTNNDDVTSHDVIVVGAGAAGLYAG
jgi:ribulose 1,5-bisphosphate synthetase/thiazole synthase